MRKVKIVLHPSKRLLEIDGVMYKESKMKLKKIGHTTHVDKVFFKEINQKEYEKKAEMIKNKIKGKIPVNRVAEEVVKRLSIQEIDEIYNQVFKKKAKMRRQDGCLGIEIYNNKGAVGNISIYD